MLNKKIIGLFVLGLALSSPLQSANAASASPGGTDGGSSDFTCYEPTKCKRGYNSKGNAMGEKNIGSGNCWCVYDNNNSFFTMHIEDDEWVSGLSEDTNGCVIPGECIANSKTLCETQNKYSTCKAVNELTGSNTECWRPNGCKTGYTQIAGQCGSDVNNYGMDDFGCGKCNCEIMTTTSDYVKYVSSGTSCPSGFSFQDPVAGVACMGCCKYGGQISCENDNPGFNCKTIDNNLGCYEPSTCKDGYTLTEGTCVQDIITYGSITECEAANPGFVCDYYGGGYGDASKWVSTGTCKDGYTLSADGKSCVANCEYADEGECETTNFNSDCTQVDGCFVHTACKTGYFKNTNNSVDCGDRSEIGVSGINSSLWIFMADPFGCGQCQYKFTSCTEIGMMDPASLADFNCTISGEFKLTTGESRTCWKSCVPKAGQWTSAAECEAANPGSVCEIASVSGGTIYYLPSTTCKDGYTLTDGTCVQDIITYGSITECEAANPGFVCDYYGGSYGDASKWVSTGTCKSNYKLENGACVPQTCDEGTYTTKSECEEKYPGFECGEVGDDSSLGSGSPGHSGGGN